MRVHARLREQLFLLVRLAPDRTGSPRRIEVFRTPATQCCSPSPASPIAALADCRRCRVHPMPPYREECPTRCGTHSRNRPDPPRAISPTRSTTSEAVSERARPREVAGRIHRTAIHRLVAVGMIAGNGEQEMPRASVTAPSRCLDDSMGGPTIGRTITEAMIAHLDTADSIWPAVRVAITRHFRCAVGTIRAALQLSLGRARTGARSL
jgi:hypothetical protein